jgi:hypothetical protein
MNLGFYSGIKLGHKINKILCKIYELSRTGPGPGTRSWTGPNKSKVLGLTLLGPGP